MTIPEAPRTPGLHLGFDVPAWVDELAGASSLDFSLRSEQMRLAVQLSARNVEEGGSPFGAAVFSGSTLVAAGVNCVLASGFTIAHAEVVTLMRAQARLLENNTVPMGPYTLVTSAEPCCQCFGALVWAGLSGLVCGAATADVEAVGFDEGPKPDGWSERLRGYGIAVEEGVLRAEARAVLQSYAARGGVIYGTARSVAP